MKTKISGFLNGLKLFTIVFVIELIVLKCSA